MRENGTVVSFCKYHGSSATRTIVFPKTSVHINRLNDSSVSMEKDIIEEVNYIMLSLQFTHSLQPTYVCVYC